MDEYFVGSIADLISNKKCFEGKAKRKELKRKGEDVNIKSDLKNDRLAHNLESKSTNNRNLEKMTMNTTVKNKKNILVEVKPKSVPKKRKKAVELVSGALGADNVPRNKKQKRDLPNLGSKPSHSEEKVELSSGKTQKLEDKFSKKKMVYDDFNKNTVFIGNIPITYDKKKVCKVFSKFGEIESARIRCVPIAEINMNKKVAAIKKQYNPKRNSLVAFVRYKSEDSAEASLKANGMIIDGHHLRVDVAGENKERDNSKAVFVGGLPFDIEDDELWEFFQNCGQIESVRVIRDSHTSMGKGFGYINFDSAASVELALQLDGQKLKKKIINIKRCIKTKNKNKLNSFDRKKSKEITNKLLCKKGRKFKEEKKKFKKEEKKFTTDFQGRKANVKHKNKKKLSKTALRQRKLVKILGAA